MSTDEDTFENKFTRNINTISKILNLYADDKKTNDEMSENTEE